MGLYRLDKLITFVTMTVRFSLCVFLLFIGLPVASQNLPLEEQFNHFSIKDGLPVDDINAIIQDDLGFIWLGTNAGLSCFDGVAFTNYYAGDDINNSLPSNVIRSFLKLPNGNIILTTYNGLCILNPKIRSFRSVQIPCEPYFEGLTNNFNSITLDHQGRIVVGNEIGFAVFDQHLQLLFRYNHFKKEDVGVKKISFARFIYTLATGNILIKGANGGWLFHPEDQRIEPIPTDFFGQDDWLNFTSLGTNKLNLFHPYFPDSLITWDEKTNRKVISIIPESIKYEMHWRSKLTYLTDSLLGFTHHHYGFRYAYLNPTTQQVQFSKDQIFPRVHFNNSLFDREGRLWLISELGLYVQSFSKALFRKIVLQKHPDSLPDKRQVMGVVRNRDHYMIGFENGSIWMLDRNFRFLQEIELPSNISGVWNLHQFQPDTLSIGTGQGLVRLSLPKKPKQQPIFEHIGAQYSTDAQYQAKNGQVWIGSYTGVTRMDLKSNQNLIFDCRDSTHFFPRQGANSFAETDSGYIWTCYLAGFSRWNPFIERFDVRYSRLPGTEHLETFPYQVASNGGEELLFSFWNQGLWRWQNNGQPATKMQFKDPALGFVLQIFPDPRPHHFWLSLLTGIALVDVSTGKYQYYNSLNGLPEGLKTEDFYFDRETDSLFFGITGAIIGFSRGKVNFSTTIPAVYFTAVKNLVNSTVYDFSKPIALPPGNNELLIQFSNPDFERGALLHYAYRLQNGVWVDVGTEKSIRFANLRPGKYHLEIKCVTQEQVSSPIAQLDFEVLPFFYQTTWFFVCSIISLLGLIVGWVRWRLAQLRKAEQLRENIAADLHDEVGASLTSVQILARIAQEDPDANRRLEAHRSLITQIRQTTASLREIVWNIQPKNDNIGVLLAEMIRHAGEVLEQAGIDYRAESDDIPDKMILPLQARQHLLRIYKESLNNLVKHSGATHAEILLAYKAENLHLTVRDNGRGFNPENITQGNGLYNMSRRAKELNARFSLSSAAHSGTKITLEIPLQTQKKQWFFKI